MWFLILGGLVACAGKVVSTSCPVETSPQRAVVSIGDPFTANCSSSSDQVAEMGWESSNGGIPSTPGVTSLPLTIVEVTDYGLGPQCFINFIDGEQCFHELPVTVYKMPDNVLMSSLSELGPLIEGEKYPLQCDILNVAPVRNLSVHWHKGNKVFYTETFEDHSVYPVNRTSVVNQTAHRDDNGSRIWCEAKLTFLPIGSNPLSTQSEWHEVNVLYPPTFIKPENEELELAAGSKLVLNCTATGNPEPVYSWHVPHPTKVTGDNQDASQPILTPSFQFPGTYNCTAANSQGSKTKRFTVVRAKRDRTTFAALVGVFVLLGVLLFFGGLYFMTAEGTFSFTRTNYRRGHPTPSGN